MRADTKQGSSNHWPRGANNITLGGLVNRCCYCTKFCRFRRVYLKSCDGHSFVGDAAIPAPPNQPSHKPAVLHSAGQAILRAVLGELLGRFGMTDAVSVLVSGCSAGGLAALLNAERIRATLRASCPRLRRFKVASLAGVFFSPSVLPGPTSLWRSAGLTPFEEQMRAAFQLGQMALPTRCTAALAPSEHWRCLLGLAPVEALPDDMPAYVYQSRLDLWQTNCVLTAGRSRYLQFNCSSGAEWRHCLGWMQPLSGRSKCTAEQWATLRAYEEANDAALAQSAALRRAGSGSFIHSCYDHCPSPYAMINTGASLRPGAVNDSINLREALSLWFLDEERAARPAWNHTHIGCWNSLVASRVAGKEPPPWCRRQECGAPDKMHHADEAFKASLIKRHGWAFGW